ncbi:MAG: M50 family metallopeptidase [Myxococcaceae bacterium]|nr:M50 family metallopeptidase [Myxococcaceae bacterium]
MQSHNPWSLALGRVAGIQLEVHVTFAVLLGWVVVTTIQNGDGWRAAVKAVVLLVAVFFTILLHELGHALTARHFGIRTLDIQLTPMGGMSNLEKVPEKPVQELYIALAGPLVSLIIAGALWELVNATGRPTDFDALLEPADHPYTALMWMNLVIGAYNLLPIFPMDGGRALRASLAFKRSYPDATRIATRVAQAGSIALAIVPGRFNLVFVLTAVWVWMSARRELRDVRERHTIRPFSIRDVMVHEPLTLSIDDTLKTAAAVFTSTFQSEFPVMQGDSVAGVLGFDELLTGLEKHGEGAPVREAMRRDPEGIEVNAKIEDALARLNEHSDETDTVLMVLDRDRLVGVVPMSNLKELIKVEKALHRAA